MVTGLVFGDQRAVEICSHPIDDRRASGKPAMRNFGEGVRAARAEIIAAPCCWLIAQTSTSGGSKETPVKELAVMPYGSLTP